MVGITYNNKMQKANNVCVCVCLLTYNCYLLIIRTKVSWWVKQCLPLHFNYINSIWSWLHRCLRWHLPLRNGMTDVLLLAIGYYTHRIHWFTQNRISLTGYFWLPHISMAQTHWTDGYRTSQARHSKPLRGINHTRRIQTESLRSEKNATWPKRTMCVSEITANRFHLDVIYQSMNVATGCTYV